MNTRAALCAAAAVVLAAVVPIVGGLAEPGYSHVSQYISELGAMGAAHGELVSFVGFVAIGVFVLALLVLAAPSFPSAPTKLAGLVCVSAIGISYIVTGLFRCDAGCPGSGSLSQSVHNLFGLMQYVGALAGFVLLAPVLARSSAWSHGGWVSGAAALAVAVGFVGMMTPDYAAYRGLSQRIAETAIFAWIAYVGLTLYRQRQQTER